MKTRNLLYSDFTLTFSNKGSLFPQTIRCPILSCPWFLCWLCFWSTLFSLFLFCLSLIFPPLHLSLWEYKQVQHLQNLVIDRFTSIFFFLQVLVFLLESIAIIIDLAQCMYFLNYIRRLSVKLLWVGVCEEVGILYHHKTLSNHSVRCLPL